MAWSNTGVHHNLSATGSYKSDSALAQEYAGLKEDGGSRVDDGEGWREIKRDSPPKNAAEYAQLVRDYAKQGFDVKAIDMDGDDFTNSNIAIKPKSGGTSTNNNEKYVPSEKIKQAVERVEKFEENDYDIYKTDPSDGDSTAQDYLDNYKLSLREKAAKGELGAVK